MVAPVTSSIEPQATDEVRRHTTTGLERKQRLLDAAAELFAASGYRNTRVEDICAGAGSAKGLFYWYFANKQALFADLVHTMRQRLRSAQSAAMDPTADPLVQIRQGTEASVRFIAAHARYFDVLDVERTDDEHGELLRRGGEVYVRDTERLVRRGQADGIVVDGDARVLAVGVLGAVYSFSQAWRNGRLDARTVGADELATFVGAWVERALSARPVLPG